MILPCNSGPYLTRQTVSCSDLTAVSTGHLRHAYGNHPARRNPYGLETYPCTFGDGWVKSMEPRIPSIAGVAPQSGLCVCMEEAFVSVYVDMSAGEDAVRAAVAVVPRPAGVLDVDVDCSAVSARARDAAQTLPTGHPAAARRVGPRRGAFGGLGVRGLLVVGLGGRGARLGGRLGSRSGVVRRARAVLARGPRALEETLRIRCSQRQPPVIGRCSGPTLAACIGLVDLASQRSDTGLFCSDARSWSSACADVLLGGAW